MRFLILIALTFLTTACATVSFGDLKDQKIEKDVLAFATDDRDGYPTDLGMLLPIDSDAHERMINRGRMAIPYLMDGLRSDNFLIVGQCALCLDDLRATGSLPEAEKVLARFEREIGLNQYGRSKGGIQSEYERERLAILVYDCKHDFK